ncbi:PH domain-containing protein [Pseudarthrobacter sp. PS3-L1]|uniref:PH domain-containing protein n=1 Tax=Pseudarthrobacter sp. PS3-L1 TaxID=3046207 RepID=UPI0024BAEA28|nr:PH domain-containing protein [Pseudarthrobacter sp. PS3-L1]MDJ0319699.1 PH domain-containing protein [Pseudarthrobacter sp. PS3-L1]
MRKDLVAGEQVIVVTRPQPRSLAVPALLFILAPALAAFASAWTLRGGAASVIPGFSEDWNGWLVAGYLVLAGWILLGFCLPRLIRWNSIRYILTSLRVMRRDGLVRRRDRQISLGAVSNVLLSQSLVQRGLRSGTISLESGHEGSLTLVDVPEVAKFREFAMEAMSKLPDGGTRGTAQQHAVVHGPGMNSERRWRA